MPMTFGSRLRTAWNAFRNEEEQSVLNYPDYGYMNSVRPDRVVLSRTNAQSIIAPIYTRIAIDVAAVDIKHVRLDENDRYLETIKSGLQSCFELSANIDQTGRAFVQDLVLSLFDEGVVAIVPVDTTVNPNIHNSFDILSMRIGKITEWYPQDVKVELYNDRKGIKESIFCPKRSVAIINNPLYAIMNDQNSALQRLIRKLNLLDSVDEASASGKLDLIIQLPYVIKSQAKQEQADARLKSITDQLAGSKYGIAYTDGTEKITQLNRPAENNLMAQVEYLTELFYNQLGLSESVFDGTADEATMLNYYNRTVEPVLSAITDSCKRSFLTQTAITQHQSIDFFRDPFRLVPVNEIANIADKFTRNEILSSNDIRSIISYKPSSDPRAEELRNKNLNAGKHEMDQQAPDDQLEDQEELE